MLNNLFDCARMLLDGILRARDVTVATHSAAGLEQLKRLEVILIAVDPENVESCIVFDTRGTEVTKAVAEAIDEMLRSKQSEYEESMKGVVLS